MTLFTLLLVRYLEIGDGAITEGRRQCAKPEKGELEIRSEGQKMKLTLNVGARGFRWGGGHKHDFTRGVIILWTASESQKTLLQKDVYHMVKGFFLRSTRK